MKINLLDEPALKFASGTHIDIRAGIAKYGTFDRGQPNVPVPIGVGLVGTTASVGGVKSWLNRCAGGVVSNDAKKSLRPSFPGFTEDLFGTRLNLLDTASRTISASELRTAMNDRKKAMDRVVDLFIDHANDIADRGGVHVLVIAPPPEVFTLGFPPSPDAELELDDGQAPDTRYLPSFHDLFKARALELRVPCQLIRPDTYGGGSTRRRNGVQGSVQDLSTCAWNFSTALYYKSGGVPWRLVRSSSALSACFVGTSFYKSIDGSRLMTSVAQVFDERGEGLIVRGGSATVSKEDRTVHLSAEDACSLLAGALGAYRREHKTMPARVVLHKTSYFDQGEIEGFRQAASDERISVLDLISVRRATVRLFPATDTPATRGTSLEFDDRSGLIYLKGNVPYFGHYPGTYIPRAMEFSLDDGEAAPADIAKEMLELSKLNFNNTQFDSGDPITVRAARKVGDILKHVRKDRLIQSRFPYFT
jgi:hypothetical protein